MNKFLTLLTFGLFAFNTVNAQSDWCGSMEILEEYHQQNPQQAIEFQKDLLDFNKKVLSFSGNKTSTYTIPVVIHVIHYNGAGNISKAQIDDGMRIINEDFNKLNSDTAAVRSIFQPYIANSSIEFKLAKIDPNGNCTEGITRTNSYLSYNKRNEPKALIQWDPFKYLNVWLVNTIASGGGAGTTLGFAQFPAPSMGASTTYGLVVRADEWGSIGLASGNDGRTVTHEIGHCLNLLHTFQGACGTGCQGSGDFVCDTPPQFDDNNNSCSFSFNTCSNDASGGVPSNPNPYTTNVPDQVENYMGYGLSCLGMFTEGQKSRMYTAINAYQKLTSVTASSNLVATGTNPGYVGQDCAPIVEIFDFDKFTCPGDSVSFREFSYGGPLTTYAWSFPGGTPSTSSSPNPTITYNTPGVYDVTLTVTNSTGSDNITLTNYVHVDGTSATYSAFNYSEGFENQTSFANDWVVVSPSGTPTWTRNGFAAKTGAGSVFVNNLSNVFPTGKDQLISPSLDMTQVLSPAISMEVAYRRRTSSSNDKINLNYSLDCGKTWSNLLSTGPSFFAFDNSTSASNFVPTSANQWRNVTIPSGFIPNAVKTSSQVRFMIELENGGGNNIFIDDFMITGQPVGLNAIEETLTPSLSIYPNPVNNNGATLEFLLQQDAQSAQIYLTNIVGKRVQTIYGGSLNTSKYRFDLETSTLSAGIYFLTLETENNRITKKLVVK